MEVVAEVDPLAITHEEPCRTQGFKDRQGQTPVLHLAADQVVEHTHWHISVQLPAAQKSLKQLIDLVPGSTHWR